VADAPATAGSEYNFVMHATGDEDRKIQLAFIPVALRPKSNRPEGVTGFVELR
jgi:hypothetical protein